MTQDVNTSVINLGVRDIKVIKINAIQATLGLDFGRLKGFFVDVCVSDSQPKVHQLRKVSSETQASGQEMIKVSKGTQNYRYYRGPQQVEIDHSKDDLQRQADKIRNTVLLSVACCPALIIVSRRLIN